uniref:Angiomotin C-terminal domain-containing protein n=1 Tax=Strigamia maritima TaxID=126957 RepID=T1JNU3_STRMM
MKSSHKKLSFTPTKTKAAVLHHSSYNQSFSGSETDVSASTSSENLTVEEKYVLRNSKRQDPQGEETLSDKLGDLNSSPFNTLIIHKSHDSNPLHISESEIMQRNMPRQLRHPHPYDRTAVNLMYQANIEMPNETESSNQYSQGDMDSKHLYNPTHLPPAAPVYPKWRNLEGPASRRCSSPMEKCAKGKMTISRSQPDLTRVGQWDEINSLPQRRRTRGRAASEAGNEMYMANGPEMIVMLTKENLYLKAQLDNYHTKISKLPKLEMEIQNVHQSYEDLVKSSEKREQLARAIRLKLEMEIKRLHDSNRDLTAQLNIATSHLGERQPEAFDDLEYRRELNRRDVLIAQLLTHNKELVAAKERQEIELSAQRATLQEQRTHIDILDTALTNAQANVVKIEEENRKKQAYVERVGQLQKALQALEVASDKRENMEKRLRNQLEKEILELRSRGGCSKSDTGNDTTELKKQLRENEERLMNAQSEIGKWEQRYLEESTMRQIVIDAAAMPKDAKIAALEKTSQQNERVIAQARTEKLKQMEDLHTVNKRNADLESRIKDLESKLAEKEAMIKVLQKHSMEKAMAFQNAIMRSPRHTPHPSLQLSSAPLLNEESQPRSPSTSSCIAEVVAAFSSLSATNTSDVMTETSGTDELKNIDSQMLRFDYTGTQG